jgi:hypothetical protein
MKKLIKIWFGDDHRQSYFDLFIKNAATKFNVEISNQYPDILLISERWCENRTGNKNPIIVYMSDEVWSPDLNCCDYTICCDKSLVGPNHFFAPGFLVSDLIFDESRGIAKKESEYIESKIVKVVEPKRKNFCSLVSSDPFADMRYKFALFLNNKKKIEVRGAVVKQKVQHKINFESQFKFSISFENASKPGYTTEKILNAFAAGVIPIYWGDPLIEEYFNPKRFINIRDESDFESAAQLIKSLDENDELYNEFLAQPIESELFNIKERRTALEAFVHNVCLKIHDPKLINFKHCQTFLSPHQRFINSKIKRKSTKTINIGMLLYNKFYLIIFGKKFRMELKDNIYSINYKIISKIYKLLRKYM